MPIITKDYIEKFKGIKKGDPIRIVYFGQQPELAFYEGFGRFLNIFNNGDVHGIMPYEIEDVDKLVFAKKCK